MANTVPQSGRAGGSRRWRAPTRGNLLTFLLAAMLSLLRGLLPGTGDMAQQPRRRGQPRPRAQRGRRYLVLRGWRRRGARLRGPPRRRERRAVRVRGGGEDDRRPAGIARHRDGARDPGRGAGMELGRRCGGRRRWAIGEHASTATGTGAGSVRAYFLRPKIAAPRHGGTVGSRRRGDVADRRISGRRAKGEAGGAVSNLCGGVWGGDGGGDDAGELGVGRGLGEKRPFGGGAVSSGQAGGMRERRRQRWRARLRGAGEQGGDGDGELACELNLEVVEEEGCGFLSGVRLSTTS
ncbi:hypothetical protein C2845_PM16G14800 [Panicum miliaceum]|uniref:Uncharacterized protein n=1 Tax=Panicum miliaceum TaxID=4540 RepID=A0A3L6PXJ4_PANMI|nr:hypothetical protein C2845_PM16G14800 [Panicum miliaceum]